MDTKAVYKAQMLYECHKKIERYETDKPIKTYNR